MNSRLSLFTMAALVISSCQITNENPKVSEESYLLEAGDLLKMIHHSSTKVIDFRKKEDYIKGHIPGALNLWRHDIEDNSYVYGGMMAGKHQIEDLFSDLGIDSNDTLVIYDDNGLCNAARLWWVLQNYDFSRVKLLHGGMESWKLAGGAIETKVPNPSKTKFFLSENPSMKFHISKGDLPKALASNTLILDTRSANEYSGKRQKKGAFKAGRIPGSMHIDWAEAIDYCGNQRIKSKDELERIYGQMNRSKDSLIVVYCHTGVRSAHTTFVLTEILGYRNIKNYDGSWTEWSFYEGLPIEKDSLTLIEE